MVENSSTNCFKVAGKASVLALPCSEWWAVPGTVEATFDGLMLIGFVLTNEEGGKCFFL